MAKWGRGAQFCPPKFCGAKFRRALTFALLGKIGMTFNIITIFPEIFDFYLKHSIIKKAQEKGVIKIRVHDLRDFTKDKHKTVDDKPFGGGRGMVVKVEPIYRCVSALTKIKNKKYK